MEDERELVRRASSDPEAFGQLYDKYFQRILFIRANIMEYVLKMDPGPLRFIIDLFVFIDREPLLWWRGPVVLMGGPLLTFLLNLLSVLRIHYEKSSRELVIALRLQWLNIAILVFCFLILSLLVLYLLLENAGK